MTEETETGIQEPLQKKTNGKKPENPDYGPKASENEKKRWNVKNKSEKSGTGAQILPDRFELTRKEIKMIDNGKLDRASVRFQANFCLDKMTYLFNSRHEAKGMAREATKTAGEKSTWQNISRRIPISSTKTRHNIQSGVEKCLSYCRNPENFDLTDPEKLKPVKNMFEIQKGHIEQFMFHETRVMKHKKGYLDMLSSSLSKFSAGLERLDGQNRKEWDATMKECKKDAEPDKVENRAYERPWDIVKAMKEPYQFYAKMQLMNGMRIAEMRTFKSVKAMQNGQILGAKGGNPRNIWDEITQEAFKMTAFAAYVAYQFVDWDPKKYEREMKRACESTGQKWRGTHGMRASFAKNLKYKLEKDGMSSEEALLQVAKALGHQRPGITHVYLRDG